MACEAKAPAFARGKRPQQTVQQVERNKRDERSRRHRRDISAKLFPVRNSLWFIVLFLVPLASVSIAREQASQAPAPPAAGAPPSAQSQQPTPQQPPPQATYAGPVIVIDPAHGGTDPGARGQNGPIEKDVVLQFARAARLELVRQGYRVVLTRDDDSNPSYDDRAAMANSYHDALFFSLHVSSTGTVGTVRAYFYGFWNPFSPQSKPPVPDADGTAVTSPAPPPSFGFVFKPAALERSAAAVCGLESPPGGSVADAIGAAISRIACGRKGQRHSGTSLRERAGGGH